MKPLCEVVVKHVLPAVRSLMAKRLHDKGFKGKEIAELLGITPAAVTQYLKKARGTNTRILLKNKKVVKAIDELVEKIAAKRVTARDEIMAFCRLCKLVRKEGLLCYMHLGGLNVKTCDYCMK